MKDKIIKGKRYFEEMSRTNKFILLIAFIGVVIRIIYINNTGYDLRQHDSVGMDSKEGHLAYIAYWYNNYKLPDIDPRSLWQFYQPPLHHIIAALWLKLNVLVGFKYITAVENIQILTMIYSCVTVFLNFKIFKELGIKGRGLVVAFALVCLHPTLILMSGSINNDILCLMLQMAAVLATIKWYKKSSMKNIVMIALYLGLSMMTKSTAVLLAPGIAFVFLYKFVKYVLAWRNADKSDNKEQSSHLLGLIKQFSLFLIIAVPIGIWWNIYAYIRFEMPIGYVPKLPVYLDQYLGSYPIWARFLDFDLAQIKSVFQNWGDPSFEHNIFLAILKTSLFGEYDFRKTVGYVVWPATILFWTNILMTVSSVVAMFYVCIKRLENINYVIKTFFGLIYFTILGSYIKFCFDFPHTCTMDFRYIVPTMMIGAAAIGLFINEMDKKKSNKSEILSFGIAAITLIFGVFAIITYYLL